MKLLSREQLSFENTEIAFDHLSDAELKKAYWLFRMFNREWLTNLGISLTQLGLTLHLPIKGIIKWTIFEQFCGGESLHDCEPTVQRLAGQHIKSILDYGVEAKARESHYDSTVQELLKLLEFEKSNKDANLISIKVTGLAHTRLLKKLHKGARLDDKEQAQWERVKERLHLLCAAALDAEAGILIDAEESWIQDPIDRLTDDLMAQYNRDQIIVYNTFQMYRKDRLEFLKASHAKAKATGYILGAKLVRGAYMEKERERAEEKGYPSPIQDTKIATDASFNHGLDYCLQHLDTIALCCATHNEVSCLYLADQIDQKGIERDHPHVFFAQLFGMGENLTYNLSAAGYNAAKLIPYGPVKEVVPYLIRRAQENTSVAGQMGRELSLLKKEIDRRKG